MTRSGKADRAAADRAEKQHGAITLKQALEAGLTAEQVEWRRRTGRWRDTASRQVYAIAGFRETEEQGHRRRARRTYGNCGLPPHRRCPPRLAGPPEVPHVTVPPTANGRYSGAVVHRSRLEPVDICRISGIPCTAPARMLVDCSAVVSHEALCELVDQTLCRYADARQVRRAMLRASRAPGRKGLGSLEEALAVWTPGPKPGSPAEMRLVRYLHRLGLPLPERQWTVRDSQGRFVARIDLAWPRWRVGLECDGEAFHGPRRWARTTSGMAVWKHSHGRSDG